MGRVGRYKKVKACDPFAKQRPGKKPRREFDLPPDEDQTGPLKTGKALRRQERRWARAADFLEELPLDGIAHWPAAARRAACCGLRFASRYAAAASLGVAEDAALIDAQRAAKLRGDALLDLSLIHI